MSTTTADTRLEELVGKFRSHTLTPDELAEFREIIARMPDDEVAETFSRYGDSDISEIPAESFERIIAGIRAKTAHRHKPQFLSVLRRFTAVAAVMTLPLIGVIVWLVVNMGQYSKYRQMLASDTEITTSEGESATLRLPDGSEAIVRSDSRLAYSMRDFNDRERVVSGAGELQLEVTPAADRPFVLKSPGLEVKVLGTRFSLTAREGAASAMLYLESGSVEMKSTASGETVVIKPNELATMNYTTGRFTIENMDNQNDARARLRGDISFAGAPLTTVIDTLAKTYDKQLVYTETDVADKTFTGYLPGTDMTEAVEIICQIFNLEATTDGESVRLKRKPGSAQ